jgi:hypothetical protein
MTRTFRSSHHWLAARLSFALDDSAGASTHRNPQLSATPIFHSITSSLTMKGNSLVLLTGNVSPCSLSGRPVKCPCSSNRMGRPDPEECVKEEDGTLNISFFEHLREWEQTELRTIFLEEMELLQPGWLSNTAQRSERQFIPQTENTARSKDHTSFSSSSSRTNRQSTRIRDVL